MLPNMLSSVGLRLAIERVAPQMSGRARRIGLCRMLESGQMGVRAAQPHDVFFGAVVDTKYEDIRMNLQYCTRS